MERQKLDKRKDSTNAELEKSKTKLQGCRMNIDDLNKQINSLQSSVKRNESIVENRRTRCETEPRNAGTGFLARHLTIGGGTIGAVALISNPVGKKKGKNPHSLE